MMSRARVRFGAEITPRPLRFVLLSSDDAHHYYLRALLAQRFDLLAVVVEPAAMQRKALLRRRRYRDWTWSQYHRWRRCLLGLNRYRRHYFSDPPSVEIPPERIHVVGSINDHDALAAVASAEPDVTVVIGTSILRAEMLRVAGSQIINVHGGYLPYYRGNHCVFFALYDGALDRVGASIHFIDAGIDTGDLIDVVVPPIEKGDNAERLYCRADRLAFGRLLDLLVDHEAGIPLPRTPQPNVGTVYRTRDRKPHHDLRLWLRRKVMGLPRGDATQHFAGDPVSER